MGEMLVDVTTPSGLIIAAAASASAAVTDLVEASRGEMDPAFNLRNREIAENLTDALQSVCSVELEASDLEPERRKAIGQLLGAASRFIEGWV